MSLRAYLLFLLPAFVTVGCYDYNLVITSEKGEIRSRPSHEAYVRVEAPEGTALKKIKKVKSWYYVSYDFEKENRNYRGRGYIYRDAINRVHHSDTIYSEKYRETDNLAAMLSLPAFLIILGIIIAASRSKIINTLAISLIFTILIIHAVNVSAHDTAKKRRANKGFRVFAEYFKKKIDKGEKPYVYFTDYTWEARMEVLTGFGFHYDRFAEDDYNRKKRALRIYGGTDLSRLRGFVLTDPYYYPMVAAIGWTLPERIKNKNYPENWVTVMRWGSARLFYAR